MLRELKELRRYDGSRLAAADLHQCDACKRRKGCAAGTFFERQTKVQLLSRSEMVKSPKDEFPADGSSCHRRKIFCRRGTGRSRQRCRERKAEHHLSALRLHPMGRDSGVSRYSALPLFFRPVLAFLAPPALDDAAAWFYLFDQHFMEHQRHFT